MKLTIADVAKMAKVSKSTVSRIINGNYEQNTEETVKRVLKVIEELDYKPNALARSLKLTKTNIIGIILSNLQNPFWANVLEGVEDTCHHLGYHLMIFNSNDNAALEEEHFRSFESRQLDGMLVNPTLQNIELYQKFTNNGFPFVAINRKIYGMDVNTITVNNIEGAKLAVNHLITSARKKIAIFLYPPDGVSPRIERLEGYKQALTENGIEIDPSLIEVINEKKGEVEEAVRKLLTRSNPPDAIFSTNSLMTLEVLEGINKINRKIPDDIALVGYDETVWSKYLNPSLTTVKQPAYEMGEMAARKLIQMIESKKDRKKIASEIVSLAPSLIIRDSCGATKSGRAHSAKYTDL
ncbi:LacI family DNA-binding transcriptional regulator [Neobacillus niacini]|uniref:LacI family DNA-binding transcriptional regulator n=1 Tax=Neobacillus niacini TaxID=86668 RepID=UPI00052F7E0C|nr:LacI family DNA-binding transcriptional regulator [Neobacillus niacini]KGM45658.1 transcriptional regulator [Neobacillus niacini]MEC1525148.1 LacI family DNA-binding transcriptional regulator [Neobacillus niacini]